MKLHVRMLEKLIELPECPSDTAAQSPLRHMLDDLGLEVKGTEVSSEGDVSFTIETLANRGDHLYTYGVAREISARTLGQVKLPAVAGTLPERRVSIPIRRVTEKCLRYALLEMTLPPAMPLRSDVASYTEEPGKRHAIVDLLNYVQLELGQPMHAFDFEKIEGEIVVDLSSSVESIEALDGKTYQVPPGSILIRDRKKIVAVAGVIGCSNSMVTDATKKVLIEAATFDPVSVRKTARAMGISTDASYFFERGVDPEGIQLALKRLISLAGGSAGAVGTADSAHVLGFTYTDAPVPEKRKVSVNLGVIRAQLNLPRLDEAEISARLKNLGYGVELAPSGKDKIYSLTVPSWRLWDVSNADDVVEDVARSVSLNRVKVILPALDYDSPPRNACERVVNAALPALRGTGFIEVITKGFYSQNEVALLESLESGITAKHVTIKNALEQNNSHMKISNVVHLGRVLSANIKRGVNSAKIFELCRVFERPETLPSDEPREREELDYNYERDVLTLAFSGRWFDQEYRKPEGREQAARLFKGAVFAVVRSLGADATVGKSDHPFLHPGIQASVKIGRSICGTFGAIHPAILKECDLRDDAFFCELDMRLLHKAIAQREAPHVSDLPPIVRDITLKLDGREQAGRAMRLIHEIADDSLFRSDIVDDFRRDGEDFRRVTYRLTFQRADRTLRHEEIDAAMSAVLSALRERHGLEMAA